MQHAHYILNYVWVSDSEAQWGEVRWGASYSPAQWIRQFFPSDSSASKSCMSCVISCVSLPVWADSSRVWGGESRSTPASCKTLRNQCRHTSHTPLSPPAPGKCAACACARGLSPRTPRLRRGGVLADHARHAGREESPRPTGPLSSSPTRVRCVRSSTFKVLTSSQWSGSWSWPAACWTWCHRLWETSTARVTGHVDTKLTQTVRSQVISKYTLMHTNRRGEGLLAVW